MATDQIVVIRQNVKRSSVVATIHTNANGKYYILYSINDGPVNHFGSHIYDGADKAKKDFYDVFPRGFLVVTQDTPAMHLNSTHLDMRGYVTIAPHPEGEYYVLSLRPDGYEVVPETISVSSQLAQSVIKKRFRDDPAFRRITLERFLKIAAPRQKFMEETWNATSLQRSHEYVSQQDADHPYCVSYISCIHEDSKDVTGPVHEWWPTKNDAEARVQEILGYRMYEIISPEHAQVMLEREQRRRGQSPVIF